MNRKKVLIAAFGFFPAQQYGGPPVSIDNFCLQMKELDVYVVARDHEISDKKRLLNISDGWNDRGNCKVLYLPDEEYTVKRFEAIISEISPDVVYIQTFFQFKTFWSAARAASNRDIPILLAPRGELCDGAMKKKYKKIPYIYLLKTMGMFKNMHFQATSEEEYQRILFYLNSDPGRVYSLENFPAVPVTDDTNRANSDRQDRLKVITLARIVPKKNLLFSCECMSSVTMDVDWDIYGQIEDTAYWDECLKAIERLPQNVHVEYKGTIEHENVHNLLRDYNVMFLPTRSENYGHSIVEAMFAGCIPVISDQTPWDGLEASKAGFDLSLDNTSAFSTAIDFLAGMDKAQISEWSQNVTEYIVDRVNLNTLKRKYEEAFTNIVG